MNPLGIYVHWPFCQSKCPYCDFNSHVREKIEEDQWREGLLKELDYYKSYAETHRVKSIFFGGGTPSLMSSQTIGEVINFAYKTFKTEENLEITLEANPTSIEVQKFREFKQAGVNRVSVGIQSLNDAELAFLGRKHSAQEAKEALRIASSTFDNFSFDLIYARPNQNLENWRQELREALQFQSPHLSLYQLTIEPNTVFETRYQRGDFKLPNEDISADLYETTAQVTAEFGLRQYEVSNYAKPEFESKHNLLYWEYEDYIGIGPGAHGRLKTPHSKKALRNRKVPETWLAQVTLNNQGIQEEILLESREIIDECLIMGLRLNKGFPESRLNQLVNLNFNDVLNQRNLEWLQENNFIELENKLLKVTSKGRICLNTIIERLLLS